MIDDSLLDQLADYTAGLLDPADAARLTRRLAADPELAALAVDVAAALDRVGDELAAVPVEPMPAPVAARLDALFPATRGGVPGGDGSHVANARPGGTRAEVSRPAGTRPDSGPAGSAGPQGRPGRRGARRGWLRGLAVGGGVVAAAALVVGGIAALGGGAMNGTTSKDSSGLGVAAPASGQSLAIQHSNANYTAATLPYTGFALGSGAAGQQAPEAQDAERLSRLEDPAALVGCLTAVTGAHPGTVTLVQYARFEGSPALIVVLTTANGTRTVVAGPDCGLPGSGDDEVFVTPER